MTGDTVLAVKAVIWPKGEKGVKSLSEAGQLLMEESCAKADDALASMRMDECLPRWSLSLEMKKVLTLMYQH